VPTLLRSIADVVRHLTVAGAVRNAQFELDRSTRSVVDLECQLETLREPAPRRAA
jgi:hypothetical protein